jgi:hypothetical protein
MSNVFRVAALASLLAMLATSVPTVPASACVNPFGGGCSDYRGAPGPLLGAGLPFLGLVGGVYWIARRFRRKGD